MILIDLILSAWAFRSAARTAAGWLKTTPNPDLLNWAAVAGVVFALCYKLHRRFQWRLLSAAALPYKTIGVPFIAAAIGDFLLAGTGRALVALNVVILAWLTSEKRGQVSTDAETTLSERALGALTGAVAGALVFAAATFVPKWGFLELARQMGFTALGALVAAIFGLAARAGDPDRPVIEWKARTILDDFVVGACAGLLAALGARNLYFWTAGLFMGALLGFALGVFVQGLSGLIDIMAGPNAKLWKPLDNFAERLLAIAAPGPMSWVGRALRGLVGRVARSLFAGALRKLVFMACLVGIAVGLLIWGMGVEPFWPVEYRRTARAPDGCPPACQGKVFHIPFSFFGTSFKNAGFEAANVSGSMAQGSDFRSARAADANFSRSNLRRADYRGADLAGATFTESLLLDARFQGADLRRADFTGAYLQGADLRAAAFEGWALKGSRYDEKTRWPAGFDPAAHGAVKAAVGR